MNLQQTPCTLIVPFGLHALFKSLLEGHFIFRKKISCYIFFGGGEFGESISMRHFVRCQVIVYIGSQTLGLFCVTCQMFKMNLLLITHPFLWWYHVAKLYWKCYIAFWPWVPSIYGFIPLVSWILTCAHIILHKIRTILVNLCKIICAQVNIHETNGIKP